MTVAVLRDQAMLVVSPRSDDISSFAKLAGKRLGIVAHRDADLLLLTTLLGYDALTLDDTPGAGPVARDAVKLLAIASEAGGAGPAALSRLAGGTEALATGTVRCARDDDPSDKVMTAVAIAIDGARAAVARGRVAAGNPTP